MCSWADACPHELYVGTAYQQRLALAYLASLRRNLGDGVLVAGPAGHSLGLGESLDASRFRRSLADGRSALTAERYVQAREYFRGALDLWAGASAFE